jgi:hypothetical protein
VERNIITWGDKTDEEKAAWYLQKDEEERLLEIERDAQTQSSHTPTPTMLQAPSRAPTPGPSTTAPPSIPTSATVTANDMKWVIYDLSVVAGQITQQLQDLMAEVCQSQATKPRTHNMPPVPRPKAWDGKGGSVKARHFLTTFYNYMSTLGEPMNSYDDMMGLWHPNHRHWIQMALNLMEGDARTWALPYLEDISHRNTLFRADWALFTDTFLKRFAPLDLSESMCNALKAIKQGKGSMAEYIANFDQYTSQTVWSDADHHQCFYDGLNEKVKDYLAILDKPSASFTDCHKAVQDIDQCLHQREAKKKGHTFTPTQQSSAGPSKHPDTMDVDTSRQEASNKKEKRTRGSYIKWMQGKCYGCGSKEHSKKDGNHEQDICNHCGKMGHRTPVCFTKYLGKAGSKYKLTPLLKKPRHHQNQSRLHPPPPPIRHRPKITSMQTCWPSFRRPSLNKEKS